jgi:hypothetical protein
VTRHFTVTRRREDLRTDARVSTQQTTAPSPLARSSRQPPFDIPREPTRQPPRKDAGKNSHACEHCSGAATPAEAADFDQVTPAYSVERVHDLLRCDLRVLGQTEVGPSNDICWPCRCPARIGVEAVGALGIVDTTVGERRCAYPRPVHLGKPKYPRPRHSGRRPVTERLAGFGISGRVPRVVPRLRSWTIAARA